MGFRRRWGSVVAGILLGVLVLLAVTGWLALRGERLASLLAATLSDELAREVRVDPGLTWRAGRWLELDLPTVRVASPTAGPGTGDQLHLDGVRLRVALLPLLRHRIELGQLEIDHLAVTLRQEADGRDNWSDLLATLSAPGAGRYQLVRIEGVRVTRLELTYDDPDRHLAVNRATLAADPLESIDGRWRSALQFSALMTAQTRGPAPAVDSGWQAVMQGQLQWTETSSGVAVQALSLTASEVGRLPAGTLSATLQTPLRLTADNVEWASDSARVRWQGLRLVSGEDVLQSQGEVAFGTAGQAQAAVGRSADFSVDIAVPHVRDSARRWSGVMPGLAVPATRDPAVLAYGAAQARIRWQTMPKSQVEMVLTRLSLDDSHGQGSVRWRPDTGAITAQLQVDQLDLDRYLPASAVSSSPQPVPLAWLQQLDVGGTLRIGRAHWQGLRARNLELELVP